MQPVEITEMANSMLRCRRVGANDNHLTMLENAIRGGQIDTFKQCLENLGNVADLEKYIKVAIDNNQPAMLIELIGYTENRDAKLEIHRDDSVKRIYEDAMTRQVVESARQGITCMVAQLGRYYYFDVDVLTIIKNESTPGFTSEKNILALRILFDHGYNKRDILLLALHLRCSELMTYMVRADPAIVDDLLVTLATQDDKDVGLMLLWAACPDEKTRHRCAIMGLRCGACYSRGDCHDEYLDVMRTARALGADNIDEALRESAMLGSVSGMRLCVSWGAMLTESIIEMTGIDDRLSSKLLYYAKTYASPATVWEEIKKYAKMECREIIRIEEIAEALAPRISDASQDDLRKLTENWRSQCAQAT